MPDLPALQAAVPALVPEDVVAFRSWFIRYASGWDRPWHFRRVVCTPADYEDFDVDQARSEWEAFLVWELELHEDDLRHLQSEADAEREEARRVAADAARRTAPDSYAKAAQRFEAANPKPPTEAPPEAEAEWEWRRLEAYFLHAGKDRALAAHRLEHGAYVERHARSIAWGRERAEEMFGKRIRALAARPKPKPDGEPRPPWPPRDSYEEEPRRPRRPLYGTPDELDEIRHRVEHPVEVAADALWWGGVKWLESLPDVAREMSGPAFHALSDFSHAADRTAFGSIRPGNIGERLLRLRRAYLKAQEAQARLDPLRGYVWMTEPAYRRLTDLVETTRDVVMDRYLEVKAIYDGLLAVALETLGGVKDP